jgi:hypothetical protein
MSATGLAAASIMEDDDPDMVTKKRDSRWMEDDFEAIQSDADDDSAMGIDSAMSIDQSSMAVNPATGLPMIDDVCDAMGNPMGVDMGDLDTDHGISDLMDSFSSDDSFSSISSFDD